MIYYARSANKQDEMETVEHHLSRAGELCSQFLSEIGYEDWGKMLGITHDFGKISNSFQLVLKGKKKGVNHALPGAAFLLAVYGSNSVEMKLMASVVASHHGELKSYAAYMGEVKASYTGEGNGLDSDGREYSLFGKNDYKQAVLEWRKSFIPQKRFLPAPSFQTTEDSMLSRMLFERFLFSALVDADWSSSAEHYESDYLEKHTGPKLEPEKALERLINMRKMKQKNSTASSSLNDLRNQLFDDCLEAGRQEPGLFTLTAPTGLGKTLSLLAFAISHCCNYKDKRRIILVLPYLSIIEQNSKDYRDIFPELLEIHSNAQCTDQTRLLSERWDAPCIVTTNIGLFEALFSSHASECRHLHQLSNSVIVLDEAQSLPAHLLDATLRTVKLLCNSYGCTVVFSTATQPSFQHRPGLEWKPREIVPNPSYLFKTINRVTWDWRTEEPIPLMKVAEEMMDYPQCCVIVNKKAHARKLVDFLLCALEKDEVFCLSTDFCPAHRSDVLEEVQFRLKNEQSCYLVATQCIEAGVDLDFPVVFRALAPLESIIQAAGRCNRNGYNPEGQMVVFVPDEEGELYPTKSYGEAALYVCNLMKRHEIDCNNLSHIDEYYQMLYEYGDGDKKVLRDAIAAEDYQETEKQYRMIEQFGAQVIVPYVGKIELYEAVRERLDKEGLTHDIINQARELIVNCYDEKQVQQYCELLYHYSYEDRQKVPTDYYVLGIPDYYKDKKGLCFEGMFDGIL